MKVSVSGFYEWQQRQSAPSAHHLADVELSETILEIWRQSRGIYGSPRVWAELRLGRQISISRKRVERLMRQAGIEGVYRRRSQRRGCTRPNPAAIPSDDLVNRRFQATEPDRLWVADVTEHPTGEGKVYLAVVLDAWSRRFVMVDRDHLRTELVIDALEMACMRRRPPTR